MITKPKIPTKFTRKFITQEVAFFLDKLLKDKEIIYIGELFEDRDYSRQRFSEWVEKYKKDSSISDATKRIKDILETRAAVNGMKGKLNPSMTIFHLKNNYKWTDVSRFEHSGIDGEAIPIDVTVSSAIKKVYGKSSS